MKSIKILAAMLAVSFAAGCASYPVRKSSSVYGYADSPGYRAVLAAARKHGVNPAFALAVARRETGGRCDLTSRAGAKGPMQVMPATAKRHGLQGRLNDCNRGANAGVLELKRLIEKYGNDQKKIIIAYNCGEGCIKRKRLPRETRNYVTAMKATSYAYYSD